MKRSASIVLSLNEIDSTSESSEPNNENALDGVERIKELDLIYVILKHIKEISEHLKIISLFLATAKKPHNLLTSATSLLPAVSLS